MRPETFEIVSLMALGCTFSLVVPTSATLYCGLNGIAHAMKPSYSRSFFPCHYLYRSHVHYFQTHHVLRPTPAGPLMVSYCHLLTKHSSIANVQKMIQ